MAAEAAPTPPVSAVPMTFREVLGLTVMRRVWYAQIVSLLGDFLALFAVISVVILPHARHAAAGDRRADRLHAAAGDARAAVGRVRRSLAAQADAGRERSRFAPGSCSLLFVATSFWQIYLVLAALSCVSSFFAPAQSVTIRSHVPPHGLMSANALMQMAMMGMRVIGPAAAGALVAAFGPHVCYAVDFVSFLASAALIGIGRHRASSVPAERSRRIDQQQGARDPARHGRGNALHRPSRGDLVRGDGDGGRHVRDGLLRTADRRLRARLAARERRWCSAS